MVEWDLFIAAVLCACNPARHRKQKKTDVVEHSKAFDHVGLLVTGPPGTAGLPFI